MNLNVGSASIALRADDKAFSRAVDKAGRDADRTLGKYGDKAGKSFMDSARKYSTAGGLVAGASVLVGRELAQAASDQAEALNKARVVFGDYSADVESFANQGAKALGMSRAAALEYTGTLGNLLLSAELLPDKAAEMSTTLVQLAADMASFNNTSPEDALEALRAGLVGETEPLKRFGVNLNDATLRQEALNQGIYDGTGVLTANQKAQAAYAIILKQTTTAQGDFARTSDGAANSARILSAQIEDQKAEIGEKLLPAYSGLLRAGSGVLGMFDKLPPAVGATTIAVTGLGGAFLFLAPKVVDGVHAMKDMVKWLKATKVASAAGTAGISGFGTAAAAAVAGAASFTLALEGLNRAADMARDNADVDGLAVSLQLLGEQGLLDGALGDSIDGLAENFRRLDMSSLEKLTIGGGPIQMHAAKRDIEDVDRALAQLVETAGPGVALKAFTQLKNELVAMGVDAEDVDKRFDGFAAALDTASIKAQTTSGDMEELGDSAEDAASRAEASWANYFDMLDARDKAVGTASGVFSTLFGGNGVEEASSDLIEAQRQLDESIRENGDVWDIQTEAGRKNREALRRVRDAQLAYLDTLLATGAYSENELHYAYQSVVSDLFDVMDSAGVTEGNMADLRAELRLTPEAIEQAFNAAPIKEATEAAQEATRAMFETLVAMNEIAKRNAKLREDAAAFAAAGVPYGYYPGHGSSYAGGSMDDDDVYQAVHGGQGGLSPFWSGSSVGGRGRTTIIQQNYGISYEQAVKKAVDLVRFS